MSLRPSTKFRFILSIGLMGFLWSRIVKGPAENNSISPRAVFKRFQEQAPHGKGSQNETKPGFLHSRVPQNDNPEVSSQRSSEMSSDMNALPSPSMNTLPNAIKSPSRGPVLSPLKSRYFRRQRLSC